MTFSLDEAAQVVNRADPYVTFGAGCHPRRPEAQAAFDPEPFAALLARFA